MAGYSSRASTISSGALILASDFNNEYDSIIAAMNATTGHSHDSTAGEGKPIALTSAVSGTLPVANGGSGAASHTDGGVLIGKGTAAFANTGVLADGTIIIGDGATNPTTLAAFSSSTGTLAGAYGGTGVANTGKTITLGGSLTTSGAYDSILTATAATAVTLPTTGTLATLAGTESLTNKKLGSLATNGPIYTSGSDGTLNSETSLGVARGGTGAATLTANNVLLGNGTSAVQVVAPGSSGNLLTSNGTTWASTALSLGTAALVNTGTSGATIPLLNGTNTWANAQTIDGLITGNNGLRLGTPVVAADTAADDLVVSGSGAHRGITIAVDDNREAYFAFANVSDNYAASIYYSYGSNYMKVGTDRASGTLGFTTGAGTEVMRLAGLVAFIGDTSDANVTQGLVVNGGSSNYAQSWKGSGLAHGMTNDIETDTFGFAAAWLGPATGGLWLAGYSENTRAFLLQGSATGEDTTDTSTSTAAVELRGNQKSGSGTAALGSTGNIAIISNNGTVRLLVKGNGDLHITNIVPIGLDEFDDIQLLRASARLASEDRGVVKTKWDLDWFDMAFAENELRNTGVIKGDFTNFQRRTALSEGAAWSTFKQMKAMSEVLEEYLPGYSERLTATIEASTRD